MKLRQGRHGRMRTRVMFVILFALAFLALAPATAAVADSESHTYEIDMEGPNFGEAPNGDRVAVTGHAEFSVNPKSAHGGGSFTHTSSSSVVRGAGTWSAIDLLDYHSYGCGIVH